MKRTDAGRLVNEVVFFIFVKLPISAIKEALRAEERCSGPTVKESVVFGIQRQSYDLRLSLAPTPVTMVEHRFSHANRALITCIGVPKGKS